MTDFSSLSLPVIAAPMFLVSGVDMVVNSCKNGVIGSFPSLNARTNEGFERMLDDITSALKAHDEVSSQPAAPFAVNLIVHKSNDRLAADVQSCVKYQVPIVITSLGVVKDVIDAIHSYGGVVFHDVIKKRHAEKAASQGVDGLILVCHGAGGHAGTAHPFAFFHEVKAFFKKTIILSGTISKGEDILAAQTLGADLAYMGTRFIATCESLADDRYKQMILDSSIQDVVYTDKISGVSANFLVKSMEGAGLDISQLDTPDEDFSSTKDNSKKAWKDVWSAGQGVTSIDRIVPVAELISQLKSEYIKALERLKKMSLPYQ